MKTFLIIFTYVVFSVSSVIGFSNSHKMSQTELDFWNRVSLKPMLQEYSKIHELGKQHGWYDTAWIEKSVLKKLSIEDKKFLKIRMNSFGAPVSVTIKGLEAHYIVLGHKVVINFEKFYIGELFVNDVKILFNPKLSLKENFNKYFKPKQNYFNKYQKNAKFELLSLVFPQAHASCTRQDAEMSINTGATLVSVASIASPLNVCVQAAKACYKGVCEYKDNGFKAGLMAFGQNLPGVASAVALKDAANYCKKRWSSDDASDSLDEDSSSKHEDKKSNAK